MILCPRCGHHRGSDESHVHPGICPACGIAYAKWRQYHDGSASTEDHAPSARQRRDDAADATLPERLWLQLTEVPQGTGPEAFFLRTLLLGVLLVWGLRFIVTGIDAVAIMGSFLHGVDLAFHEFGHIFFRPFGDFMTILGGSLFQVLLPLALLVLFVVRQRDNFAAAVALWWCGQNFIDLAPYIRDAQYRVLPLVGGGGEESHDWGNLLTRLDAIESCYTLARVSFMIGTALMLLAIAWGAWLLWLQHTRSQATHWNTDR